MPASVFSGKNGCGERDSPGETRGKKFSKQLVEAAKILKNSHACWKKRSRRTRPREPTMDPKSKLQTENITGQQTLLQIIPNSNGLLGSREDIAPPESFHEQINPAVADSDALLAAIPKSETRDLEISSSRSTEQKSATAAKLASLRIDKDFRELQGGNAGTPNAKSFIPKQFSKARAFSFPAECTRIPKNPAWLIRWHSSNCRLSSETAALTKETTPLSDRKVHFRRQSCFTLGQPLPTASIPKSVTPWQAVITRDLNFFKPRPEPMTQKPLSFMF
nr:hypothetical protein Iba_chr10cCG11810 [Ipomoea batatas]